MRDIKGFSIRDGKVVNGCSVVSRDGYLVLTDIYGNELPGQVSIVVTDEVNEIAMATVTIMVKL